MTGSQLLITALAAALMVLGVVGTIVPILPGLALVWVTMAAYGVLVGFGWAGWAAMAVATALVGLGLYLNIRIPQRSASGVGLTVKAQVVAVTLALAGFFLLPPFGAPVGFVLGVFLMRLNTTGSRTEAWTSTKTIVAALLRASLAQFACGVGMFVAWLGWVATVALSSG